MRTKWPKLKKSDLIICYWHDITSVGGWMPSEEAGAKEPVSVVSVGWFVNDNDNCLRLTNTVSDDEHNILVLPKGIIDHIEVATYNRTKHDRN